MVEQVVVHPTLEREFLWHDIPHEVKQHSEMSFYSGYELDDVYGIFGVNVADGALAVVRPDGYVGITASLRDVSRVQSYLEKLIRKR